MSFDPARFDAAWRRYVAAAVASHAAFPSYLHSGAAEEEIAATERAIEASLPQDLRHLLKLHNGSEHGLFVLPRWELFSASRIADEWSIWADLYHSQFKPEGYTSDPSGPVQGDEWWRLKWIPFCGDGGGNHLCVDLDPAPGGTTGQVITMWHDSPERDFIASSLTEFVEIIADDFERGELRWDEEWGGVYATPDNE
jgi:cell wall assembly regulator SMI1